MSIREITLEELRQMEEQEGLVLQGCGGDPQEWLDGMNDLLTGQGILKKGTRFEEACTFRNDGVTCMLFPFDERVLLDVRRLTSWRLETYATFGGTWLSDYIPNKLVDAPQEQNHGQSPQKPDCPLIGQDGNIFNLMGIASQTLKEHGLGDQAREMRERIYQSHSYDSALSIIGDYVNITAVQQNEEMNMKMY